MLSLGLGCHGHGVARYDVARTMIRSTLSVRSQFWWCCVRALTGSSSRLRAARAGPCPMPCVGVSRVRLVWPACATPKSSHPYPP